MSVNTGDGSVVKLTLAQLTRNRQSLQLPTPFQNPPLLPFNDLDPEVFERVVAEVVSRRHNLGVQFYGRRGQKQYGLDIVEREPSQRRSLYQVKRYQEITDKLLREAVQTYAGPVRGTDFCGEPRRFDPYRFVVVTSAQTENDTNTVDALAKLQDEYTGDLVIEAWGAEALGRALRDAHHLVVAVFGPHWGLRRFAGSRPPRRPGPCQTPWACSMTPPRCSAWTLWRPTLLRRSHSIRWMRLTCSGSSPRA